MNVPAQAIIALWIFSTIAQFATCALLVQRELTRSWVLAIAGLALNAGKSAVLMVIWYTAGFRAYGAAWGATRWVHWLAVALLCLQALWALSRVWPQGRPFAVMLGSLLVAVAGSAAALQSGWIIWPGWVGGAIVASRTFSFAALLVVFWGGLVYRALRVVTHNACAWNTGLQAALCVEIACLAVEALAQRGPGMVAAQIAKQAAYMLACWWWWRMGAAGEDCTLPEASGMPDRAWKAIVRLTEREKWRVAV